MSCIETTDELMTMFHHVHETLRNNEGLAETEALVQFNNIFSAFLLQPRLKDLTSRSIPRFTSLSGQDSLTRYREMIAILRSSDLKEFFEPVTIQHPNTILEIASQLSRINLETLQEDLRGKMYEYFLGSRGDAVTSSLGQYFTNRKIVSIACRLVRLKPLPDGTVPRILDPTCGTGGFLIRAAESLSKQGIEWSGENVNRLVGLDTSPAYIKAARINLLCCTKVPLPNLIQRNTYTDEIDGTFDYVLGNPPYAGAPMRYGAASQTIKDFSVPCNVKECLFTQLFAMKLKPGAVCAVVVPSGLLFKRTSSLVRFRKILVQLYIVETIVQFDNNEFENTKTESCLLIFHRKKDPSDPATTKVNFLNPSLELICRADTAQLARNHYQLVAMPYMDDQETLAGEMMLSSIATLEHGTRIVKKDTQPGPYIVYGGGGATFTTDQYNRDNCTTCKVSRFGISENNCVMLLHGRYFLNDSGLTIRSKDESIILTESLWCCLIKMKSQIYARSRGTAQKNLDKELFGKMKIAIPRKEEQARHRKMIREREHLTRRLKELDRELAGATD